MTDERLAEIRADLGAPKQKHERLWSHALELLEEVDRLRAECERLHDGRTPRTATAGAYALGMLGFALAGPAATERAARLCDAEADNVVGGPLAARIRSGPHIQAHEWIWDDGYPEGGVGADLFCTRCYHVRDFKIDEAGEPPCRVP